jgi:hypothetical protein
MTIGTLNNSTMQAVTDVSSQNSALPSPVDGFTGNAIDIHPALDEVRKLKEFQPVQPSPLDEWLKHQPWLKQITKTFGDILGQFFDGIKHLFGNFHPEGLPHLPQNIRDIFSGLSGFLIALVGLYAFYLFLTFLLQWQERKKSEQPTPARVFEETSLINSQHHYQQAQQAARNHQYAEGIRELYLATLCLLDEKALVPYTVTRTNLEYQAQLHETVNPKAETSFTQLAQKFEAMRYGQQEAGSAHFETSDQAFQSLQTSLPVSNG